MTCGPEHAEEMAARLHKRYGTPLQAITIIGQCMTKALFAGKAEAVAYWALVHSHYRNAYLPEDIRTTLEQIVTMIEYEIDDPE